MEVIELPSVKTGMLSLQEPRKCPTVTKPFPERDLGMTMGVGAGLRPLCPFPISLPIY